MKKIISFLVVGLFLISCGTPGRVCGGAGGRRCVENTKNPLPEKYPEIKRNS